MTGQMDGKDDNQGYSISRDILWYNKSIYLWRKVVCFVLSLGRDPPNQDASDRVLGALWKAFDKEGFMGHGSMTFELCNAKVFEYWMSFSLKIKLN
jgi:hypothetical protein